MNGSKAAPVLQVEPEVKSESEIDLDYEKKIM